MMDPPKVLLEQSLLHAVASIEHPEHDVARTLYLDLVERYRRNEVLLVAVSDHLRPFRGLDRGGAFAPVDNLFVGFQHRRAARRLTASSGFQADHALSMVMCERNRVGRIATVDPTFPLFDLHVERVGDTAVAD